MIFRKYNNIIILIFILCSFQLLNAENIDLFEDEFEDKSDSENIKDSQGSITKPQEFNQNEIQGSEITNEIQVNDIVQEKSAYVYSGMGRPDPYKPSFSHLNQMGEASANYLSSSDSSEIPIVSVLQLHELSKLQIVGIWTLENSINKALVMTPDNIGVIIKVDDIIGNKGGKVVSILPNQIIVRVYKTSTDGTRLFEDVIMNMSETGNVEPKREIIKKIKTNKGGFLEQIKKEKKGDKKKIKG